MIRWGSNVSFSCNEGFLLKGDATSTCTVHGNLTSLPHCEAVSGNQKEGNVATAGLIVGVTFGLVILLGIIAFVVYPKKSKNTAVTLVSRVKVRQKLLSQTYSVSPSSVRNTNLAMLDYKCSVETQMSQPSNTNNDSEKVTAGSPFAFDSYYSTPDLHCST
ncbi:uncharacterized protein LOC135826971 [Sycon ciliatum]|uniref:uncharacterized protein LOC135826971 n=1 Tax=Sycon ciliatum TaxID=27933 RepID=UPI0031F66E18